MQKPLKCYDLSKLAVLIVDKQAPMRSVLRQVLRAFGVRYIYEADSPEKAFEEFNYRGPDMVLVDWCPEFDGIGLAKRIRTDASSCYPQVPIIMITAFGETNRVFQARDAGASEYMVKPVSANLIYLHIVNAIENVRPFIRSKNYTGPCRRRHRLSFAGKDRRNAASANKPQPDAAPGAAETAAPAKAA